MNNKKLIFLKKLEKVERGGRDDGWRWTIRIGISLQTHQSPLQLPTTPSRVIHVTLTTTADPSLYTFLYLSLYSSLYLSLYSSLYLSLYSSLCFSVLLFVSLFVLLFVSLFVLPFVSICTFLYSSFYLSSYS